MSLSAQLPLRTRASPHQLKECQLIGMLLVISVTIRICHTHELDHITNATKSSTTTTLRKCLVYVMLTAKGKARIKEWRREPIAAAKATTDGRRKRSLQ